MKFLTNESKGINCFDIWLTQQLDLRNTIRMKPMIIKLFAIEEKLKPYQIQFR